jgi:hypothetical protein
MLYWDWEVFSSRSTFLIRPLMISKLISENALHQRTTPPVVKMLKKLNIVCNNYISDLALIYLIMKKFTTGTPYAIQNQIEHPSTSLPSLQVKSKKKKSINVFPDPNKK